MTASELLNPITDKALKSLKKNSEYRCCRYDKPDPAGGKTFFYQKSGCISRDIRIREPKKYADQRIRDIWGIMFFGYHCFFHNKAIMRGQMYLNIIHTLYNVILNKSTDTLEQYIGNYKNVRKKGY